MARVCPAASGEGIRALSRQYNTRNHLGVLAFAVVLHSRSDTYHQSFVVALLAITPLSVAMAWLYWRSNGSLLLTMLMHAAVNNTTTIVPSTSPAVNPFSFSSSIVGWTTAVLLWAGAAYFLSQMRSVRLQPIQSV
jgi:membrane protease YdiL (CAAX protease family)